MGRQVNWDDVPDSSLLPQNIYEVMVESITEKTSQKGKLMYETIFRVVGGAFDGTPLYERYTVGNDNDPNGDEPETWKNSIGVRFLKRMLRATGVTLSADVDEALMAATGQHLMITVDQETDDGSREGGKYRGRVSNRIAAYYPMGEREVPAASKAPAAGKAVATATVAATPKTAAKAAMATCGVCKQSVLRADLLNHIKNEHAEGEE